MKAGQSLIEVLIAFAVTVIIGVGLISASLVTQRSSNSARNNSQAAKLAQEYAEKIRVIRDIRGYSYLNTIHAFCKTVNSSSSDPNQWTINIIAITGASCTPDGVSGSGLGGFDEIMLPDTKTTFYRVFLVYPSSSPNSLAVDIYVYWMERDAILNVSTSTVLSNWEAGT